VTSMAERDSSTTAMRVAQLRAAHQLVDGEPKILYDPVAVRLFEEDIRASGKSHWALWKLIVSLSGIVKALQS
jgi:O-methyltransferase involved in polyketide biosynthesis